MTGRVDLFNPVHHDIVVRTDQFDDVVYVPSPEHIGPEVVAGSPVVMLDRRPGDGFRRGEGVMTPARLFSMLQKNREPVLYVILGVAPSKPVPEDQARATRHAQLLAHS